MLALLIVMLMKKFLLSSNHKCYYITNHVDAIQDMWPHDTAEGEVVKR